DALPIAPTRTQVTAACHALAHAQRPLLLVGGSRWDREACAALRVLAEGVGLPVACAFRHQDLFDNRHPQYAGDVGIAINPRLAERVRNADVLLVVGERLGEMTTSGYTLVEAPTPRQTLIHVHPGSDELGCVYQAAIAINATPREFIEALTESLSPAPDAWGDLARSAHAEYETWQSPRAVPGAVDLWQIVRWLDERLPENAIVANGAGNYATWIHRIFRYRLHRTQLAPYSGSMGYGVPAAVAAKLVHRDRVVLSWNGDGCFLMNGQELATAVQYRLAIVFVVIDNGMYGTIRMHQERQYPDRVSGTSLINPDFAALARAYGAMGETIASTAQFAPAFERALATDGPALLHVKLDPQALTPSASLDALREQGRRASTR